MRAYRTSVHCHGVTAKSYAPVLLTLYGVKVREFSPTVIYGAWHRIDDLTMLQSPDSPDSESERRNPASWTAEELSESVSPGGGSNLDWASAGRMYLNQVN